MAESILTYETVVAVGRGTTWSLDLREEFQAWSIAGLGTPFFIDFVSQRDSGCIPTRLGISVSLTGQADGTKAQTLVNHQFDRENPSIFLVDDGICAYGEIEIGPINEDDTTQNLVIKNPTFLIQSDWYEGTNHVAFSGAGNVTLPKAIGANDKVVVWIHEGTGAISVAGETVNVTANGFYEVSPTSRTSRTIAGAAGVSGVVLTAPEWRA